MRRRARHRRRDETEPAVQRLGHFRVGSQRRQIIAPQGDEAARYIVGFAHLGEYRTGGRRRQPRLGTAGVFDEAGAANRCIVAEQHLRFRGTPGA
jgi:hypothetical protein